ncbi:hypothetical protein BESB_071210 [Besnoitia besnoiti]|uniref:Uncharacterized protein n=1 Tax=Besnoitia besnoiti TaxID=94643 RepID=A0A2A9M7Q9_BESBE|nr:uncharacterized protein BESB_071210 [Besnoitia besnoiti]PFH33969.1 hypothetical protein BESB_071210 [Besnoitia besnoiti]
MAHVSSEPANQFLRKTEIKEGPPEAEPRSPVELSATKVKFPEYFSDKHRERELTVYALRKELDIALEAKAKKGGGTKKGGATTTLAPRRFTIAHQEAPASRVLLLEHIVPIIEDRAVKKKSS